MTDWTIIVPVKGTSASKSRFGPGDHRDLALAMALDTVEAALAVAPVIVVTIAGEEFQALGARVVADRGRGLEGAISTGLGAARPEAAVAILLGDHPALSPDELRAALEAAAPHRRAVVADAEGTGTALLTARSPADHDPAFGEGSHAAHRARGYIDLVGEWPGLVRDVDVPEHLDGLTLGRRTRAFLRG